MAALRRRLRGRRLEYPREVRHGGWAALDLEPASRESVGGGEGRAHRAPCRAVTRHHEVGIACRALHDFERAIINASGEDFTVDPDLVGLVNSRGRLRPEDDPEARRAPTRAKLVLWRILAERPYAPAGKDVDRLFEPPAQLRQLVDS